MNDDSKSGICYGQEYLKARIAEFKDDGIDVSLEENVLELLKLYEEDPGAFVTGVYTIFDIYKDYMEDVLIYDENVISTTVTSLREPHREIKKCGGIYEDVVDLSHESIPYADEAAIISKPVIQNVINAKGPVQIGTDPTTGDPIMSIEELYKSAPQNISIILTGSYEDPVTHTVTSIFPNSILDKFIETVNMYEHIANEYDSTGMILLGNYKSPEFYLLEEVITISERFINSNVQRYVYLPKLKKLDISYNEDLSNLNRLGELTYLRELNASHNFIPDISSIDWNAITYLRRLYLADNHITDIQAVENLTYLEDLDVSKNWLSGELKFNFTASQKYLKNFNLSDNKLEDISVILKYLNNKVGADFANYLAREDTLNINLNNQDIDIVVDESVFITENPSVVEIDLPIIFSQLLAIDAERTTFGLRSLDGTIESEGRFIRVDTRSLGDQTGSACVITENGYDTCIGDGTTVTVKYKVEDRTVSDVKVTPATAEMAVGEEQVFTAEVIGENLLNTKVNWTISGASSAGTTNSTFLKRS